MEVREARNDDELAAALTLRERVFCEEQGVSADADRDDVRGLVVAVEGERVIGTCRLLFRAGVARLGRLAVEPERRGDGVAGAILREAATVARRAGAEAISLHAQTYAKQLYLRDGYLERGATFVEEGIEHVSMEKPL